MSDITRVQARFWVRSVTRFAGFARNAEPGWAAPHPQIEVAMSPVSPQKAPENAAWASATPAGEIKLTVGNAAAAAWFDSMLGQDIAITFEARTD